MPAFFIRERAIDPERLGRALSALEHLDKSVQENPDILKHMESLYNPKFFLKTIKIENLSICF